MKTSLFCLRLAKSLVRTGPKGIIIIQHSSCLHTYSPSYRQMWYNNVVFHIKATSYNLIHFIPTEMCKWKKKTHIWKTSSISFNNIYNSTKFLSDGCQRKRHPESKRPNFQHHWKYLYCTTKKIETMTQEKPPIIPIRPSFHR